MLITLSGDIKKDVTIFIMNVLTNIRIAITKVIVFRHGQKILLPRLNAAFKLRSP